MKNPMSVEALAAWLEKKPAGVPYNYTAPQACLIFQYLTEMGLPVYSVAAEKWTERGNWKEHPISNEFRFISIGHSKQFDWTYGGALKRAREFIK